LTPSQACIDLIASFEGCRLIAYLPTPNDVWTIGYGHTEDVQPGDEWTQEEAEAELRTDVTTFSHGVNDALNNPDTLQNQFDAMTSLAFNIGLSGFEGSTVLREHNAANYEAAADAFALWNKQAGQVLQGLVNRRAAEAAMYRGET
jgi:lysozyme